MNPVVWCIGDGDGGVYQNTGSHDRGSVVAACREMGDGRYWLQWHRIDAKRMVEGGELAKGIAELNEIMGPRPWR